MMNTPATKIRPLWLLLIMAATAPLLAACSEDGPFEEVGEEIDDAADEVEDEL
jgi:hypothetical protein